MRVLALRKQFGELFSAKSARRVLKFVRISVAERKEGAQHLRSSPSAPAKATDTAFAASVVFVRDETYPRHARVPGRSALPLPAAGKGKAVR